MSWGVVESGAALSRRDFGWLLPVEFGPAPVGPTVIRTWSIGISQVLAASFLLSQAQAPNGADDFDDQAGTEADGVPEPPGVRHRNQV